MSPLAVPALTRRERIMRVIAPQPLPLELVPLLKAAHYESLRVGERVGDLEAKQQTLEMVTNGYLATLEMSLPAFYKQVRDHIETAKRELEAMATRVRVLIDDIPPRPEPSWTRALNRIRRGRK